MLTIEQKCSRVARRNPARTPPDSGDRVADCRSRRGRVRCRDAPSRGVGRHRRAPFRHRARRWGGAQFRFLPNQLVAPDGGNASGSAACRAPAPAVVGPWPGATGPCPGGCPDVDLILAPPRTRREFVVLLGAARRAVVTGHGSSRHERGLRTGAGGWVALGPGMYRGSPVVRGHGADAGRVRHRRGPGGPHSDGRRRPRSASPPVRWSRMRPPPSPGRRLPADEYLLHQLGLRDAWRGGPWTRCCRAAGGSGPRYARRAPAAGGIGLELIAVEVRD